MSCSCTISDSWFIYGPVYALLRVSDCTAEFAGSFFFVLGAALPALLGRASGYTSLFTDGDDDEEVDDDDDDGLEMDGADAKRSRVAVGGSHNSLRPQLEALIHPKVVGPVLETCFYSRDRMPAQNVCYVVEWLLRNSSSKLSAKSPRLHLLNYVAFQTGTKALLLKMWGNFKVKEYYDQHDSDSNTGAV